MHAVGDVVPRLRGLQYLYERGWAQCRLLALWHCQGETTACCSRVHLRVCHDALLSGPHRGQTIVGYLWLCSPPIVRRPCKTWGRHRPLIKRKNYSVMPSISTRNCPCQTIRITTPIRDRWGTGLFESYVYETRSCAHQCAIRGTIGAWTRRCTLYGRSSGPSFQLFIGHMAMDNTTALVPYLQDKKGPASWRGLIVVWMSDSIVQLAKRLKAPILADPYPTYAGLYSDYIIDSYDAFLASDEVKHQLAPDCVIQSGPKW